MRQRKEKEGLRGGSGHAPASPTLILEQRQFLERTSPVPKWTLQEVAKNDRPSKNRINFSRRSSRIVGFGRPSRRARMANRGALERLDDRIAFRIETGQDADPLLGSVE